jgi:hypothetical protein
MGATVPTSRIGRSRKSCRERYKGERQTVNSKQHGERKIQEKGSVCVICSKASMSLLLKTVYLR